MHIDNLTEKPSRRSSEGRGGTVRGRRPETSAESSPYSWEADATETAPEAGSETCSETRSETCSETVGNALGMRSAKASAELSFRSHHFLRLKKPKHTLVFGFEKKKKKQTIWTYLIGRKTCWKVRSRYRHCVRC